MKPVRYCDLKDGALFRIFSERRGVYIEGQKTTRMVRSRDFRTYKKHGNAYAQTKGGTVAILALTDLVMPLH